MESNIERLHQELIADFYNELLLDFDEKNPIKLDNNKKNVNSLFLLSQNPSFDNHHDEISTLYDNLNSEMSEYIVNFDNVY